jgi:hypothetical protein
VQTEKDGTRFLWWLGVIVHICNPSPQEAEAGGLAVQGQPGLHSKTESGRKVEQNGFPGSGQDHDNSWLLLKRLSIQCSLSIHT